MAHMKALCAICNTKQAPDSVAKARLSGKKVYNLLLCNHCHTLFFSPKPSREALAQHYSKGYSFYRGNNYKAQGKGAAFASKYLKYQHQGNFLDIGCASGDFLAGVRSKASGWQVFGTDINPEVVASVRETLGLDVRLGEIEDVGFDAGFFDVIRVQDILEHVLHPKTFLHECRRIINEQGTFYLSVPNGLADAQNLIDYYHRYHKPAFSGAGHIYFFSFQALALMFEKTGFHIEKAYSYNIKKGLRSFSVLPKSRHWKRDLTPPDDTREVETEILQHQQKKRSLLYYQYQFFKDEATRLPGIWRYAQDFMFVLKPRK